MFRERRRERDEEREATHNQMRQRMIFIGDDCVIENYRGERVFKLDGKALRARKTIRFEYMQGHELYKNILEHEYTIGRDGDKVAEISRRWFRVRDTYGVEVLTGENDALILAATAVIDIMAHPDK